jgi:solute carrier family 13 (sodium-dependent dicarboxylate transporter), member 2/3/5
MKALRSIKILLGPLTALAIILFTDLDPANPMVTRMAAITAWVAIWWLTEAVHLAVTALIPFLLIPTLGIVSPKETAFQYMDPIIFLFIGGFLISFAIERWQLHKRIALGILMRVGTKSHHILFGVMFTSYIISMWISNTATVMMMISAVLAIIFMIEKSTSDIKLSINLPKALLIGLSYAASIGGMATLVGTPPNMIFFRAYSEAYPDGNPMTFAKWFSIGLPVSVILFTACYFVLRMLFLSKTTDTGLSKTYFKDQHNELGEKTIEQKIVALIFISTAVLWFTRSDLILGSITLPGWNRFFENPEYITDSTVAVFMALLLFVIPSKKFKGTTLLTWNEAKKLPFDIILLFGSGFALAKGFGESGLSSWLAGQLSLFKNADIILVVFSLAVLVCIISEFASNVASIQLMIPVLVVLQQELQVDPLLLMIPATLAASTGFMMPVATAPNTIVFGSGKLQIRDMVRAGFFMDLIGICVITLLLFFIM